MKYKIIILILLFNFIQSCGNKEKKRTIELQEQKTKVTKDSIVLANKNRLDSIIKIEEKIAIGKINFGISKEEYLKKKKEFLKLTNSELGKYKFKMRETFDDNGGLYFVWLRGNKIHYDYYERDMLDEFISLKDILVERYGAPTTTFLNDFPSWTDFDKNESKCFYNWSFGNKSILVCIGNRSDYYYSINIYISYNTPEKLEKYRKESEQRKKKSKENAIKNL